MKGTIKELERFNYHIGNRIVPIESDLYYDYYSYEDTDRYELVFYGMNGKTHKYMEDYYGFDFASSARRDIGYLITGNGENVGRVYVFKVTPFESVIQLNDRYTVELSVAYFALKEKNFESGFKEFYEVIESIYSNLKGTISTKGNGLFDLENIKGLLIDPMSIILLDKEKGAIKNSIKRPILVTTYDEDDNEKEYILLTEINLPTYNDRNYRGSITIGMYDLVEVDFDDETKEGIYKDIVADIMYDLENDPNTLSSSDL